MAPVPYKFLVFGNSGSGKSTLAKALQKEHALAHLDLDTLAWHLDAPTQRRPLPESLREIRRFVERHDRWVVEGCYADLLEPLLGKAQAVRFLNPPVATCQTRCRNRPWEPHKYASMADQDKNLPFLLQWVSEYPTREGPLSLRAHRKIFDAFRGDKLEIFS